MNPAVEELSEYEIERGKPIPSKAHSIVQINIGTELNTRYRKQYRVMSELSLELEGWQSAPGFPAPFTTISLKTASGMTTLP